MKSQQNFKIFTGWRSGNQTIPTSGPVRPSKYSADWDKGTADYKISITGTKEWVGGPEERPTIELQLYKNGVAYEEPVSLANGTTTHTWENLPFFDSNGKRIIYTVDEVKVPTNYTKTFGPYGLTVINTFDPKKIEISVKKDWADGEAVRPDSVKVVLTGKAENSEDVVKTIELSQDNNWQAIVSVPSATLEGVEYQYTLAEPNVPENFKSEVTGNQADGFTVTNTYESPKIDVTATKEWVKGPDKHPAVKLQLYRNGAVYGDPIELAESTDRTQTYTWEKLDKTDETGKDYNYTVAEVEVPENYHSEAKGLKVINTYVQPTDGEVTVTKDWDGPKTLAKPEILLTLYRVTAEGKEEAISINKTVDGNNTEAKWTKIQSHDINGNPYTFFVKENYANPKDVNNENWTLVEKTEVVEGKATITNKAIKPDGSLKITKVFENEPVHANTLFASRSADEPIKFEFTVTGPYGFEKVINLAPGQSETLENLYYGQYKVEETETHGYTPFYDPEDGTVTLTADDNEATVTVTNKNIIPEPEPENPEVPVEPNPNVLSLTVKKIWKGGPKPETTIELWRKGLDLDGKVIEESVGEFVATAETTEHTFEELAKHDPSGREFQYYVVEPHVPENYEATIDGLTVTNTYIEPLFPLPWDLIWPSTVEETKTHYSYVVGYPDGSFGQNLNMTRAEAVTIIVRLQGYKLGDKTPIFADTKDGDWYNQYLNAAYKNGILEEKAGENFRPDQAITRAELARLISVIDKKSSVIAPFEDVKGHKYEAYINQAYGNGRILGYPDGSFRPDAEITRAEVTAMVNRFYDRNVDEEGLYKRLVNPEMLKHFIDLDKSHWAYYEIMEAANTHEYVRRHPGQIVENWKKIK